MAWRRTDPLQEVDALILRGEDAWQGLQDAVAGTSPLFASLRAEHGPGWAVLFAGPIASGDAGAGRILPRLEGARALYSVAPGWWLPVGVEADAPSHVHEALRDAMCANDRFEPPVVVVPRFAPDEARTDKADIYLIRNPAPLSERVSGADLRGQAA